MNNKWLGEHKALRQAIFVAVDAADIAGGTSAILPGHPAHQPRALHQQ